MATFTDCCTATANYRTANPGKPRAFVLTKNDLSPYPGYDGIRVYNGIHNGNPVMIIVGVTKDANGDYQDTDYTTVIKMTDRPCPTACSGQNALNS